MSPVERLSAAEIRAGLDRCTIGSDIIVLDQTTSTNDVVAQMAKDGAPEGLVVFAEHQTAGRGQRGNVWKSAPGKGLLFSVLLRPHIAVKDSFRLVEWALHGIARTIENVGLLKPMIKSPNDVYIDGRKVAGVLVEMRAQPGAAHLAIVGIGLNLNQGWGHFPEELRERVTSLAIALGGPLNRNAIAIALLTNLDQLYRESFQMQKQGAAVFKLPFRKVSRRLEAAADQKGGS